MPDPLARIAITGWLLIAAASLWVLWIGRGIVAADLAHLWRKITRKDVR